jgi:type IV secretion system protein TrbL
MATPTYGVLNHVLNTFRTQIDSGFGALTGPVEGTLGILIVISVATMAMLWAVDETNHIWGHLIRKILLVGFWAFIITNWHSFAMSLISGMGKLGISAGGGSGLASFLDNPSLVFKQGLEDAKTLLDYCDYLMGGANGWGHLVAPIDPISWIGFGLKQLVAVAEVLIATVIVICAYGWLALEVVVTVIEFHIVTLVAFCVLPFGVLRHTSSLAENAIAYVFRAGFKAMVLGIIIALGSDVLTKFTLVESPTSLPTLEQMSGLALGVLVILMLAINAPRYASAVIAGSPSNSAGALVGTAGGVAAAGLLAGRAALSGGQAIARGLNNSPPGGSVEAAKAASSLGGSGGGTGGASPGSPRAPSPAPSGGGSPPSPSTGGASVSTSGGPISPGGGAGGAISTEAAITEVGAAEAISEATGPPPPPSLPSPSSAPPAPSDSPSPTSSSGRSNMAWYATPVGLSSLTAPQLAAARRSYDLWTQANPDLGSRYSFDAYVEYAQARHAESVAQNPEQDEA